MSVESYKKVLDSNRREFAKLEAALTNAQARLYRYAHWTPEHTIEEWLADRQRIVEAKQAEADAALRQQLTDAQAMIERLRHFETLSDENYRMYEMVINQREALVRQVARLREAAKRLLAVRSQNDNGVAVWATEWDDLEQALRETGA